MDTFSTQILRIIEVVICGFYFSALVYWMIKIPEKAKFIFLARLHVTAWVVNILALYIIYTFNWEGYLPVETRVVWGQVIVLQVLITSLGILLTKIRLSIHQTQINSDIDNGLNKFDL